MWGEPLADLILGKVDAFEIAFFEDSPFDVLPLWYTLLNAGLHVPAVGAGGKDNNGKALGAMRTYARLLPEQELTYAHWIEAVRAGRTFVTNGPLIRFTINGLEPGSTLPCEPGSRRQFHAEARSWLPFDQLVIICNGQVVASAPATGSPPCATLEGELPCSESGWLAALCHGSTAFPDRPAHERIFAHTSPFYLTVPGKPNPRGAEARKRLAGEQEKMLAWVEKEARCDSPQEREKLARIFVDARDKILRSEGN